MKTKFALVCLLALSASGVFAQEKPELSDVDRIRIAEAFRIGQKLGNEIWKTWDKAPFAVLLITPQYEFLIRHSNPSSDFTLIEHDSRLQSDVYFRKKNFSPDLLATFPAVGGVPTIVIGQAELTAKKTSAAWVATMLHEHFHQLQYSQQNYYPDVNALNLSGGDQSGMWMLNYPFPYAEPEVGRQFSVLSRLLVDALQTRPRKQFATKVAAYLDARRKFQALLKRDDYRYFSFQTWQEGVARYTEYRVAQLAATKYRPTKEFRSLKDYQSFKQIADATLQHIISELTSLELGKMQRVAFYPLGAGEALLLDRINPKWRDRYFTDRFYNDRYFE